MCHLFSRIPAFNQDTIRLKYPDYGRSWMLANMFGGLHPVMLFQAHVPSALGDDRRLDLIEKKMIAMMEFLSKCCSAPTLHGFCMVGTRVGFYGMDTRTKNLLNGPKDTILSQKER